MLCPSPLILGSSGLVGLAKVDKRDLTEARPFNFMTDDRAELRAARLQKQASEAGPSGDHAEPNGHKGGRALPQHARKSVAPHSVRKGHSGTRREGCNDAYNHSGMGGVSLLPTLCVWQR